MKHTKVLLTLEDENAAWEAYVSRSRMQNGCFMPYLEMRVINMLMIKFNHHRTMLSWHGLLLIWLDPEQADDEPVVMRSKLITVNNSKVLVWDLGDIGLMWEVATGKEKHIYKAS